MEPNLPQLHDLIRDIFSKAQPGLDIDAELKKVVTLSPDGKYSLLIKHLALLSVSDEYARSIWENIQKRIAQSTTSTVDVNALSRLAADLAVNTDPLTGIFNRAYYNEKLSFEAERSARYRQPLSLLVIDIDFFKRFNDTWGHKTGDEVLRAVAQTINSEIRNIDLVARYGGEEFVAILPNTATAGALILAERVRLAVSNLTLAHPVTISVGLATMPSDATTTEDLFQKADAFLYQAKQEGRNRVCCTLRRTSFTGKVFNHLIRRPFLSVKHHPYLAAILAVGVVSLAFMGYLYLGERLKSLADWKQVAEYRFSDPAATNDWYSIGGAWVLTNGMLGAEGKLENVLQSRRTFTGNVRVEYEAFFEIDRSPCDLSVSLFGEENKWLSGYLFQFGGNRNQRTMINRPGLFQREIVCATSRALIKPGKRHRIVAEYLSGRVNLWVDDRLVLTHDEFDTINTQGFNRLNLYSHYPGARYRWVRIYQQRLPEKLSIFRVGDLLMEKKMTGEARESYREILEQEQTRSVRALAQYKIGKTFLTEGDEKASREAFQKVVSRYGKDRVADFAALELGRMDLGRGLYREGLDRLEPLRKANQGKPLGFEIARIYGTIARERWYLEPEECTRLFILANQILKKEDSMEYFYNINYISTLALRNHDFDRAKSLHADLEKNFPGYAREWMRPANEYRLHLCEGEAQKAYDSAKSALLESAKKERFENAVFSYQYYNGIFEAARRSGRTDELLTLLDELDRGQAQWIKPYNELCRAKIAASRGDLRTAANYFLTPKLKLVSASHDAWLKVELKSMELLLDSPEEVRVKPLLPGEIQDSTFTTQFVFHELADSMKKERWERAWTTLAAYSQPTYSFTQFYANPGLIRFISNVILVMSGNGSVAEPSLRDAAKNSGASFRYASGILLADLLHRRMARREAEEVLSDLQKSFQGQEMESAKVFSLRFLRGEIDEKTYLEKKRLPATWIPLEWLGDHPNYLASLKARWDGRRPRMQELMKAAALDASYKECFFAEAYFKNDLKVR